ncbi:MAG: hypothetical protein ACI3ZK_00760 [Candidatus Cryptobacteroides sp.]
MKHNRLLSILLSICFLGIPAFALAGQRWEALDNGSIRWIPTPGEEHKDHIEMSGKSVSVVLRYGVDSKGRFSVNKSMVWPLLRTLPDNTHASLMRRYDWNPVDAITVSGRSLKNLTTQEVVLDGTLSVRAAADLGWFGKLEICSRYFPSTENPALVELYTLRNTGERPLWIEIPESQTLAHTPAEDGKDGSYTIVMAIPQAVDCVLNPGESLDFGAYLTAFKEGQQPYSADFEAELAARRANVDFWTGNLVLNTPDPVIDRMFAFSKIRACESIYATEGGPMHGPGGESYYAAIWANDQAEYINPYFPFTGYEYGNESALNSFRHFARFMNDEWKPIPSSIVAEGRDIWNGAGDRGDAAMIAYGASRYALARGSRAEAEELWPLIEWCLEYCRRNLNADGVVESDTDELENRFPSGDANLCTSTLYYDALNSAVYLAKALGKKTSQDYGRQAAELRKNIDRYFAANVEGFDTYAYYKGNEILRSWICIPLTAGIFERKEGTIEALFSDRLWTENGLLTQAGDRTFWDRSTLYALRGVFAAGETEKALSYLHDYSCTRLLGDHVPYAIEAWPEGGQRHLSAESGLYGRIITEGLFGIRPTGFNSFRITPRLPLNWPKMSLSHIRAFGKDFSLTVRTAPNGKVVVDIEGEGIRCKTYPLDKNGSAEITIR